MTTNHTAEVRELMPHELDSVSGGFIISVVPVTGVGVSPLAIHGFDAQPDPPAIPVTR
jgi:hypothetical protein